MTLPREVAVVGAGTMGAGIARIFADGGASVRLTARREESLDAARERAGDAVAMTTDLDEALAGADLVVETIVEEVEPKRAVLARAEELAAPDAILTTNTSSLSVDEVGRELKSPERFAGLHFLNPPELVQVVEIVGGARTAPETLETLRAGWRSSARRPSSSASTCPASSSTGSSTRSSARPTRSSTPGSAPSRTSTARSPPGSARAGPRSGPSRRWISPGSTSTRPSRRTSGPSSRRREALASIAAARERGSIRADFDAEELKERRDRVLRLLREA